MEGVSKRSRDQLFGRTEQNRVVVFDRGTPRVGDFVMVKVTESRSATLKGCLLYTSTYLQTGVIMMIGLLAKTAILITEYAIERRRKGMGIVESAYSAAQVRLRPILTVSYTHLKRHWIPWWLPWPVSPSLSSKARCMEMSP